MTERGRREGEREKGKREGERKERGTSNANHEMSD